MVSNILIQKPRTSRQITEFFARIKKEFPVIHLFAVLQLGLSGACLIASFFDPRELMGLNIWIKPAKFLFSSAVFLWTIAWYLSIYPFRKNTKRWMGISFIFILLVENFIISMQASRGVLSHYNINTVFDACAFRIMAIGIGALTLLMIFLSIKSFTVKLKVSGIMLWSIRIALLAFLFGSVAGSTMAGQMGHNIGVTDGGEGLPLLNWSTVGGDLRVAHFMGLHALQVIPLATFLITKNVKSEKKAFILSIVFAILYMLWIIFTYLQAQFGQPLIAL